MATSNRPVQQCPTNFQIIEPLFYREFENVKPIFLEWTIERIPRKFSIKRIKLDEYQMHDGWLYTSYNTKGQFVCSKCSKDVIKRDDATWNSAYTTILVRVYYGPDVDESGQVWLGGWIEIKILTQQCKTCNEYITGQLYNQQCENFVNWLHRWIAHIVYGYPFDRRGYQGRRSDRNHHVNRCEACATGWCHYRGKSNKQEKKKGK